MRKLWDFFSPSGRASRTQYWLTLLINVAVFAATIAAFALFQMREYGHVGTPVKIDSHLLVVALAAAPFCIAALAAALLVPIKRMHDRNKSGWWFAFGLAAPLILFSIAGDLSGGNPDDDIYTVMLCLVGLAIWGWIVFELGFLAGVPGGNRFGTDG